MFKNKKTKFTLAYVIITLLMVLFINDLITSYTTKEITYNEFLNMVESNEVESVIMERDRILIIPQKNNEYIQDI